MSVGGISAGGARKNLVVVRAGKNSLHPKWLEGAAGRSWDLIISLYDPAAEFDHGEDVRVVVQPGGKWDGIYALFAGSDLLSRYEYIWLPDDDIATTGEDIDAVFEAMRRYDLDVAQPALTWNSYFSHFVFMRCPGFKLRFSNFIEIMVPCLKAGLLGQVLEDFRGSMSGYGMDSIWCRLSPEPRYKAAILDSIAVHHTRPVGRALRGNMAKQGLSPEEEEKVLHARYDLRERIRPIIYAAIDEAGRRREGRVRLGFAMARAYLGVYREFMLRGVVGEKVFQLIRRQTTRRANLRPLRRVVEGEGAPVSR